MDTDGYGMGFMPNVFHMSILKFRNSGIKLKTKIISLINFHGKTMALTKGRLILKCLFDVIVSTKIAT